MLPYAVGQACTRCGEPIMPGDRVDLDHNDKGTDYLGFAHMRCNRRAGAIKGNRDRKASGDMDRQSRAW